MPGPTEVSGMWSCNLLIGLTPVRCSRPWLLEGCWGLGCTERLYSWNVCPSENSAMSSSKQGDSAMDCFQRWIIIIGLSVLTLFSLESLGAQTANSPLSASLRLKWLFDPGFAGELVALKAGLFERQGLK